MNRLLVGVQNLFREIFKGMKLNNVFADSFINCLIIVLIKLYSFTILLNQKSLKLMMKNLLLGIVQSRYYRMISTNRELNLVIVSCLFILFR